MGRQCEMKLIQVKDLPREGRLFTQIVFRLDRAPFTTRGAGLEGLHAAADGGAAERLYKGV